MAKKCKCGICGKEFKSLSARRRHKKKGHKQSKSQEVKKVENKKEIVQEEPIEEKKETLKEIPKIKMPKEQAKEEWKKYVQVLKKRKEKYLKTMKQAMYQMKEGRELIDIYKIMKQVGLNENNEPRLAISRADLDKVTFAKRDSGTGDFEMNGKDTISLPQNTFKIHWNREEGVTDQNSWRIDKKRIRTKVPIIPVEILPEGSLSNYYVLWETNEWEELPETKDPLLLKRISENLFAILGSWDLTELEQSIISGGKI